MVKRTTFISVFLATASCFIYAGFNLGMPGAVKSTVKKMDTKIAQRKGTALSVERNSSLVSSALSVGMNRAFGPGDQGTRISPTKSYAALSKVWLPDETTYNSIKSDETFNTHEFTSIGNLDTYKNGCFILLDNTPTDPERFDLDSRGVQLSQSELPPLDTNHIGAIIQAVYFEMEVEDLDIRWYAGSDGTYQRKDILIKYSTNTVWKFAYDIVGSGITLFSSRQTLTMRPIHEQSQSNDVRCLFRALNDPTPPVNDSGVLLEKFHFVHHNAVGLKIETGEIPKELIIKLQYGGWMMTSDPNNDGKFSSADFGISVDLIDVYPITGAMDLGWEYIDF